MRIKTKEILYFGYRQGYKVYLDGKKYPTSKGYWYTDLNEQAAVNRAIKRSKNLKQKRHFKMKTKIYDQIGAIIAYETGELNEDETLELFQHLVNNGLAWSLQGHYGRTASYLIEAGLIKGG